MSEWRTTTVVALCQSMRETQDYSALPILADALQDADYRDEAILSRLRDRVDTIEAQRLVALIYSEETAEAIVWLENFAAGNDVDDYQMLMEAAQNYILHDEYLCEGGRWKGHYCDDEFWDKYEIVVGKKTEWRDRWGRGSFFSCSC